MKYIFLLFFSCSISQQDTIKSHLYTSDYRENKDFKYKVQIVKEVNDQYYLHVIGKNGKTLIWSEGYMKKQSVKELITLLDNIDFKQEVILIDKQKR
jgi:uncharacterized protein YegP (UPF0339 family)